MSGRVGGKGRRGEGKGGEQRGMKRETFSHFPINFSRPPPFFDVLKVENGGLMYEDVKVFDHAAFFQNFFLFFFPFFPFIILVLFWCLLPLLLLLLFLILSQTINLFKCSISIEEGNLKTIIKPFFFPFSTFFFLPLRKVKHELIMILIIIIIIIIISV